MTQWAINDERTRFCVPAMRANGGAWGGSSVGWSFRNSQDHANALSALYRATRATLDQRDRLAEMVLDGTAAAAWENVNLEAFGPRWLANLESGEARRLIAAGNAARRVLGYHPLEDLPEPIGYDGFDTAEFESIAAAKRLRVASAA